MRKIEAGTFLNMEIPVSLSCSNDGKQVFVSFRKTEHDCYVSRIRKLGQNGAWIDFGEGAMQTVSGDGTKLLYVTAGEEGRQKLIIRDLEDGKEVFLGEYLRIQELSFSENGKKLVFTAAFPLKHEPEDLPVLSEVQWIDRVKFKTDGVGLFDGTYRQIGVYDLENGTLSIISEGRRDLSEPGFVGNDRIIYLAIPVDPDNSDDVHLYSRELTGEKSEIWNGPGGPIGHLSVSPDQKYAACLAHDNRYWEATNFKIYLFDLETGVFRCLTEDYDRSVGNYVINDTGYDRNQYSLEWNADGSAIDTLITDGYSVNLYRVSTEDGSVTPVTRGKQVLLSAKRAGNVIYAFGSDEVTDARIVEIREDGTVSSLWEGEISEEKYQLSRSKSFWYNGCDGSQREGLYYPGTEETKGIILDIHGGPHYCHGYDLSYDIQLLTAKGYGVVLCNPAGSQGSGEKLARESYHDWGGKDYQELLTCLTAAQKTFSLEKLPAAVMGGSYGGFMTNWMISHTDRFTCAISERSTCNRYSQAGTSDCAFRYGMFEFDGAAWENPQHYMEHSPISYVKNVHTPVLLIHGDRDMNCPLSQSEEWYSALKMEGKKAYLAVFKGEYHSLTGKGRPKSRLDRYHLLLWWFDRYMKKGEAYV